MSNKNFLPPIFNPNMEKKKATKKSNKSILNEQGIIALNKGINHQKINNSDLLRLTSTLNCNNALQKINITSPKSPAYFEPRSNTKSSSNIDEKSYNSDNHNVNDDYYSQYKVHSLALRLEKINIKDNMKSPRIKGGGGYAGNDNVKIAFRDMNTSMEEQKYMNENYFNDENNNEDDEEDEFNENLYDSYRSSLHSLCSNVNGANGNGNGGGNLTNNNNESNSYNVDNRNGSLGSINSNFSYNTNHHQQYHHHYNQYHQQQYQQYQQYQHQYHKAELLTLPDETNSTTTTTTTATATTTITSTTTNPNPNPNTNANANNGMISTKNKKKGYAALSEMVPINLENEQKIFFSLEYRYNPVFEYNSTHRKYQFSKPHTKYLKIAKLILNKCIDEFGNDDVYLEKTGGRLITKEETMKYFDEYVKELGLEDYLSAIFSEKTVAPTSVIHDPNGKSRMIISLPITYREKRIRGVLNHEIGTHFLRKYNDRNQPWFKNRKAFELKSYIIVEEGLAALNQTLDSANDPKRKPYLFNAALHYYSAYMSSVMSFEELFHDLEKYIKDPNKRWKECVRVKRGTADTSQGGGMYKDQVKSLKRMNKIKKKIKGLFARSNRDTQIQKKNRFCHVTFRKDQCEGPIQATEIRDHKGRWIEASDFLTRLQQLC